MSSGEDKFIPTLALPVVWSVHVGNRSPLKGRSS